mmetsp:Transcript_8326/g.25079  ORF Transcript_8326/g.25079 Transcript_8326/m.25079 type:complete len:103 (+) Transcript_8326:1681-1989(+)
MIILPYFLQIYGGVSQEDGNSGNKCPMEYKNGRMPPTAPSGANGTTPRPIPVHVYDITDVHLQRRCRRPAGEKTHENGCVLLYVFTAASIGAIPHYCRHDIP